MLKDEKLRSALAFLPHELSEALRELPPNEQALCEEIRMRACLPLSANIAGTERVLSPAVTVEPHHLARLLEIATRASVYMAQETMREGYITLEGGHRLGLCGRVVRKNETPDSLHDISSASLRIAREIKGVAAEIFPRLSEGGFKSTLILSPPGLGKTTLLRDLIRLLSESGIRVGVADERGEIAACHEGRAQFDLGPRADIIDRAPKVTGINMLLKNMSPGIIAVDEITTSEDIACMKAASYCGVELLATAHAASLDQLHRRPLYNELLSVGVFGRAIIIRKAGKTREYIIEEIKL